MHSIEKSKAEHRADFDAPMFITRPQFEPKTSFRPPTTGGQDCIKKLKKMKIRRKEKKNQRKKDISVFDEADIEPPYEDNFLDFVDDWEKEQN